MSTPTATIRVAVDERPPAPADVVAIPERLALALRPSLPAGADGYTAPTAESATPTQVANPGRATLRTLLAVLVGLVLALPTINAALSALQGFLLEQSDVVIPGWLWAAVNGAVALVGLVSGLVTRVLAVPGVNAWIVAHVPALAAIPTRDVPAVTGRRYRTDGLGTVSPN